MVETENKSVPADGESPDKGVNNAKKLEYLEDKESRKENLEDAAALAAEAQPTGFTFETTSVQTKVC